MSRSQDRDNSTEVTLFPFLAVLLCTMGSLLLVLIVMAKVSREKAARAAEVKAQNRLAVVEPDDQDARRRLDQVNAQLQRLEAARADAAEVLRMDQLRLRHMEDHMRRLQDQLVSLQLAAAELDAMEEDHFDDRIQAEREVERLQQLIAETRQQIEDLRKEQGDQPRTYAVVPYEGLHSTRRWPLYIECRKDVVILQPSEIELTPEDFAPPLGAGNPLAAALRAAREFIVSRDPALGESEHTEPYPLILVRPEGIGAYYRVRAAIESWDTDFGYELLESDWEIEFPSPDPKLTAVEHNAVRLARARQRMLAAAAPRAYARSAGYAEGPHSFEINLDQQPSGAVGDNYHPDELSDSNSDQQRAEVAAGPSNADPSSKDQISIYPNPVAGAGGTPSLAGPPGTEAGSKASVSDDANSGESASYVDSSLTQSSATQSAGQDEATQEFALEQMSNDQSINTDRSAFVQAGHRSQRAGTGATRENRGQSAAHGAGPNPTSGPTASNSSGSQAASSVTTTVGESGGGAAASLQFAPESDAFGRGKGKDWAVGSKGPADVPVRRNVQVIVRRDRLSILPERPENANSGRTLSGGKEILLPGATEFALEDFVSGIQDHVSNWGIAGSGLYWRPVLVLNVAPDGQERAADLQRLLENSGIEVRNTATANRTESNNAATTR